MSDNPYQSPQADLGRLDHDQSHDAWSCPHCDERIDPKDAKAMRKLLCWNKCVHCNGKLRILPEGRSIAFLILVFVPAFVMNFLLFGTGIQVFGEFPDLFSPYLIPC